jgi:hypothetical protein
MNPGSYAFVVDSLPGQNLPTKPTTRLGWGWTSRTKEAAGQLTRRREFAGQNEESGFDGIGTLARGVFGGRHRKAHLFPDGP